jgi:molybdenum cofactor cytidylyltransferase
VNSIHGILLAAGESHRMGYPKPLLKLDDGETFVAHLARLMLPVVARLTIVIGAHADRVRPAIPDDPRIAVVHNPDWERGQLSSIKTGIRALPPEASAAMVHLSDHPKVKGSTFEAVADAYRSSGKPIAIARQNGHRGHPVIFGRALFAELLDAPEDQGARVVVNADPSRIVYIDVEDPGILLDLDTPEDVIRAALPPPKVEW